MDSLASVRSEIVEAGQTLIAVFAPDTGLTLALTLKKEAFT